MNFAGLSSFVLNLSEIWVSLSELWVRSSETGVKCHSNFARFHSKFTQLHSHFTQELGLRCVWLRGVWKYYFLGGFWILFWNLGILGNLGSVWGISGNFAPQKYDCETPLSQTHLSPTSKEGQFGWIQKVTPVLPFDFCWQFYWWLQKKHWRGQKWIKIAVNFIQRKWPAEKFA